MVYFKVSAKPVYTCLHILLHYNTIHYMALHRLYYSILFNIRYIFSQRYFYTIFPNFNFVSALTLPLPSNHYQPSPRLTHSFLCYTSNGDICSHILAVCFHLIVCICFVVILDVIVLPELDVIFLKYYHIIIIILLYLLLSLLLMLLLLFFVRHWVRSLCFFFIVLIFAIRIFASQQMQRKLENRNIK